MKRRTFTIPTAGLRWIVAACLATGFSVAKASEANDLDGDGIPNIVDPDIDNDGIPNALDDNIDGGIAKTGPFAGQYIGDHINNDNPSEKDIDDDGQADDSLGETDIDGDSKTDDDPTETDIDGDRREDDLASELDIDGDGRLDNALGEDDIDGDSLDDDDFMETDIDGDAATDDVDDDIDGDNLANSGDTDDDTDGDGILNADDDDADGDGISNRDDDDDDNDGDRDEDDGDHHDEPDEMKVVEMLASSPAAPAGSRVRLELKRMATGKIRIEVEGEDLAAGTYDVLFNGQRLGPLVMHGTSETEGETRFETDADDEDEYLLPFDPIGLPVAIARDGTIYFTGVVPSPPDAPGDDGSESEDHHHEGILVSKLMDKASHLPAEAVGEVEVVFGLAGVVDFEVEAEHMPEGDYQLTVDGTFRGTIHVTSADGTSAGYLRFSVAPIHPGDLLLDFPVAGAPVTISQNGEVLFSGLSPATE
ncbi:hypothetical protein [Haloferula sargassicola]|uniref:Uncharacterized protein n=1 Tax=Haloferula sargassicola TaxID=490096 RepID=A0ABP9USR4_9BACT